jgi:hypothetical protein
LYSGIGGFFDKLEISDISSFETKLYFEWNTHAVYKPYTIVYDSAKLSDNLNKDILGYLLTFFLQFFVLLKTSYALTRLKIWLNNK